MKKRGRKRTNLLAALTESETPVFAVDARRRLVFFNAGCERLTGWTAEDVLGRTGEYRSDGPADDVQSLVNALCPPPSVFDGERATAPVFLPRREGAEVPRELVLEPLVDDDDATMVVGFVRDLADRPTTGPRASGVVRYHAEIASLRASLRRRYGRDSILGRSLATRRHLEQLELATRGSGPVVFIGERGTGRTHSARVLHHALGPSQQVLVPLDCARLDPHEMKRTLRRLFDAEAVEPGAGLQPGTVLLANVESLPRDVQQIVVDGFNVANGFRTTTRLLATSTEDPERDDTGDYVDEFRYLLTTQRIRLEPLRERLDDLEPLAVAFLEETNRGADTQVSGFDDDVWHEFRRYHWPGNVAELKRVIVEARERCEGHVIRRDDLPFGLQAGLESQAIGPVRRQRPRPLDPLMKEVETEQIQLALREARGNRSRAAELLGITRARLYRRIEQLGLEGANGESDRASS